MNRGVVQLRALAQDGKTYRPQLELSGAGWLLLQGGRTLLGSTHLGNHLCWVLLLGKGAKEGQALASQSEAMRGPGVSAQESLPRWVDLGVSVEGQD